MGAARLESGLAVDRLVCGRHASRGRRVRRPDLHLDRQRRDVDGTRVQPALDVGRVLRRRHAPRRNRAWQPDLHLDRFGSELDGTRIGPQLELGRDLGATARGWWPPSPAARSTPRPTPERAGPRANSIEAGDRWRPPPMATRLAAALMGGAIYTSNDSGVTWTARASGARFWNAVASSADGTRLVAVEDGGQVYTTVPTPSTRRWPEAPDRSSAGSTTRWICSTSATARSWSAAPRASSTSPRWAHPPARRARRRRCRCRAHR